MKRLRAGYRTPTSSSRNPVISCGFNGQTCSSQSAVIWRPAGCHRWSGKAATPRSNLAREDTSTPRSRCGSSISLRARSPGPWRRAPAWQPHYWLDPANGRRIAQAIAGKLAEIAPGDAAYFNQRYADFDRRLSEAEKRWDALMAPHKGLKVVTYHRSWPNFADRFGLDVVGYIEPRPGIPPVSRSHSRLDRHETPECPGHSRRAVYRSKDPQRDRSRDWRTGMVMPPSVGGVKETTDYFTLFDYN